MKCLIVIMRYLFYFFTICNFNIVFGINVTEYLIKYGFLNEINNAVTDINDGLIAFQEYYDLPIDGYANNETLKLMERPRCGVKDNPTNFAIAYTKWKKTNLSWYFPRSSVNQRKIAERAFQMWSDVSSLRFTQNYLKPDIVIAFADGIYNHSFNRRCITGNCNFKFDGKGTVLAHAFYPDNKDGCTEVHLDMSENWYDGIDAAPLGQTSLLYTLAHELGHTLGLRHSSQEDSIMYAYYNNSIMKLSQDDIDGIQYLYGKNIKNPISSVPITTTQSTTTTTEMTREENGSFPPDLCFILPDRYLITTSRHLYIFYNGFVWILNIDENKTYRKPKHIKDYLSISNFSTTPPIYQTQSGDVVLFTKDYIYFVEFPSLALKDTKPISSIGLNDGNTINCVFSTYSGKTYIFYESYYYIEIDECSYKIKNQGLIEDIFPGIPTDVNNAFRYINGMLYFFRENTFYEFNEFTNKVTRAGNVNLNLFGINCPQQSIFQQIRELLSRLSSFEDKL